MYLTLACKYSRCRSGRASSPESGRETVRESASGDAGTGCGAAARLCPSWLSVLAASCGMHVCA